MAAGKGCAFVCSLVMVVGHCCSWPLALSHFEKRAQQLRHGWRKTRHPFLKKKKLPFYPLVSGARLKMRVGMINVMVCFDNGLQLALYGGAGFIGELESARLNGFPW
jgi:hypothetical protein